MADATKRIFFITKLGAYQSTQFMHQAVDLHELLVDIMQVVPPKPGGEYTDTELIRIMTERSTWGDESYFLISEYNPKLNAFRELVKDSDG